MSQSVVPPVFLGSRTLNQDLSRTELGQRRVHRVHRVRRVLFPSRTRRPDPRPEPDLVQRGLLLLWALLCLQIYTEDAPTELQSQEPDMPDLEPQDGTLIRGTAESGPWRILTTTDAQQQCVVA